jgi:hypothetical protein
MAFNLWLDDTREPPLLPGHPWISAKSLVAFKEVIQTKGIPLMVSLDHDLNQSHYDGDYTDQQTGYDAVLWLVAEVTEWRPLWHVHTANLQRARVMEGKLRGYSEPFRDHQAHTAAAIQEYVKRLDLVQVFFSYRSD